MNQYALDAFLAGAGEGVPLAFCLFLIISYLRSAGHVHLVRPLYAAVAVVFAASAGVAIVPVTVEVRGVLVQLVGYVFGLFYLFSLGALYHSTGTNLFGPLEGLDRRQLVLGLIVFLAAIVYFAPDMAVATLSLVNLRDMAGGGALVPSAAAAGFAIALGGAFALTRKNRFEFLAITAFPQLLLALALVKLVSGGVAGFAEFSLISSVQAGMMKLVHDVVHQVLVLLLVPDHPVLSVTAWNFIAVLFGTTAGLWLSLLVFLAPLVVFLKKHFSSPVIAPDGLAPGPALRKYRKAESVDRMLKAVPVLLFLAYISVIWFSQRDAGAVQRYDPKPVRIVADGLTVTIPIRSPGVDLLDGSLHKFVLFVNREDMRLLVVKRPDGTLAVCLDACDICPPDGYAQVKDHVVCMYCNTPIPLTTVGKPGGCNPVPLDVKSGDKDVRISLGEIIDKWLAMKIGKRKEGIRR